MLKLRGERGSTKVYDGTIDRNVLNELINSGIIDKKIISNIINEDDPIKRNQMVDTLFKFLPNIATGYMPVAYTDNIGNSSTAVKIDDVEIFYYFFEQMHNNQKKGITLSKNISDSVDATLDYYFCPIDNNTNSENSRAKRTALSTIRNENGVNPYKQFNEMNFTGQENELKSIKVFKGQNCAVCTERSAVAFNLLLSLGLSNVINVETHIVCTQIANIEDQQAKEGHAYVIYSLEANGKKIFYLFDNAQGVYKVLQDNDIIDKIIAGEPILITKQTKDPNTNAIIEKQKVYANATTANLEKARNLMHSTQQLSQQSSHQ